LEQPSKQETIRPHDAHQIALLVDSKILAEIMSSSDPAVELKVFVGVNTVITRFAKKSTKCALNVRKGCLFEKGKYGSF
jgi:hypothetical protein